MKIDHLQADLDQVADLARWALHDGLRPQGRRTARRRDAADQVEQTDPDYVPGAKYDTGLGSYARRTAYQAAMNNLARAEVFAAAAVGRTTPQPPLTRPTRNSTRRQLDETVRTLHVRLSILAERPAVQPATGYVEHVRHELDRAWRRLTGAFEADREAESYVETERTCTICELRPIETKSGHRCQTCKAYHRRNGRERPRKLDSIDDALAAADRRRARGESHGDESGSCTQPLRPPDEILM